MAISGDVERPSRGVAGSLTEVCLTDEVYDQRLCGRRRISCRKQCLADKRTIRTGGEEVERAAPKRRRKRGGRRQRDAWGSVERRKSGRMYEYFTALIT